MTVPTGKFERDRVSIVPRELGVIFSVPTTAAGIKAKLRVLREQEAAELLELDREFEELRRRRKEVMVRAWQRGNVVRLQDVMAKLERKK